jgi:hypothetical protein
MAKRCNPRTGCSKPRANWWKQVLGVDWFNHNTSGGSDPSPSAFDDIWGWWRADEFTGTSGSYALTDKSGNSRTMTQAAGTLTPGTAANGQARFTGNATARFTSAATLENWPITVFTIGRRTNNATCGFFGHTGASGFGTLWYGYEASNAFNL